MPSFSFALSTTLLIAISSLSWLMEARTQVTDTKRVRTEGEIDRTVIRAASGDHFLYFPMASFVGADLSDPPHKKIAGHRVAGRSRSTSCGPKESECSLSRCLWSDPQPGVVYAFHLLSPALSSPAPVPPTTTSSLPSSMVSGVGVSLAR